MLLARNQCEEIFAELDRARAEEERLAKCVAELVGILSWHSTNEQSNCTKDTIEDTATFVAQELARALKTVDALGIPVDRAPYYDVTISVG